MTTATEIEKSNTEEVTETELKGKMAKVLVTLNQHLTDEEAAKIRTAISECNGAASWYEVLHECFRIKGTDADKIDYAEYLDSIASELGDMDSTIYGMTVEEICSLDDLTICIKIKEVMEKDPEKYGDFISYILQKFEGIKKDYELATKFLYDWWLIGRDIEEPIPTEETTSANN